MAGEPSVPVEAAPLLLVTNDGREFSVDQAFVEACSTLKMFADEAGGSVPLPNVDAALLEIILKGTVPAFEDPREIFPLMQALDYLGHDAFLDDCAKSVAEAIKGLRPDEIRYIFGLEKPVPVQ
jgi:hypothetical protein